MQEATLRNPDRDDLVGAAGLAIDTAGPVRRLGDDVLQTAQEAVLAPEPDSSGDIHAIGYEAAGDGYAQARKGAVARYVAAHPAQSAALAALAGGLLMALLKSSLRGRSLSGARQRLVRSNPFSRWR